jgi:hypothetical protein
LNPISQGLCDYGEIHQDFGSDRPGFRGPYCGGNNCLRTVSKGSGIVRLGCFKR